MIKIVTIIGARPQFIKAAAVSREIQKHQGIIEVIVHTGQHFDENMSQIFFQEMNIPKPDYNLSVSGLSHGAMTGRMIEKIEEVLQEEKPDWVVVYGDTNSTLAGTLAASKLHIKVAHIEAGLRSFNMKMPEEQNRIVTDRLSTILFCPTDQAIKNLTSEGYQNLDIKVIKSGDVMQDAAMFYRNNTRNVTRKESGYILSTVHRAENTDNPERLASIVSALNELNKKRKVILPLHPRTEKIIKEAGLKLEVEVIEPVGYLEMITLLENCSMVICDSGGLQKEAFFFNKPCITMRDETEWVELVDLGVNLLVGADKKAIISAYNSAKELSVFDDGVLYGGGKASNKIVQSLLDYSK